MRIKPSILFRAFLSIGLIIWLILRSDIGAISAAISHVDARWFFLAVSLHATGVLLTAWRWGILLRASSLPVPTLYLARSFLIASFFNYFLPTNVGGDVYRAYDIGSYTGKPERSLGILLVERTSGLFALVLLAVLASPWSSRTFGSLLLTSAPLVLTGLFILAALLMFWGSFVSRAGRLFDLPGLSRIKEKVRMVHEAIISFRHQKAAFGAAFMVGLLLQFNVILHHYFIARSLDMNVGLEVFLFLVPLVSILLLLPASINGIGVRENAFVILLSSVGAPRDQSVAFCVLLFAAMLIFGLAGGITYALSGRSVAVKNTSRSEGMNPGIYQQPGKEN